MRETDPILAGRSGYLGEGKGSAVARSGVGEVPGASEVVWAKALFQGGPGQRRRVIGIPGLLGRQRAVWASSSLTVTMTMAMTTAAPRWGRLDVGGWACCGWLERVGGGPDG